MMSTEFSGALDQRLMLQRPVDVTDGGGGQSRTWQNVQEFWAQVRLHVQDEHRYAGHVATRQRYIISLRRDGDVPLDSRVLWRGQPLTIVAVEDDPATTDRLRIIAEREREQ
jgi:SPP1 family predicted phage head-tail adaptor